MKKIYLLNEKDGIHYDSVQRDEVPEIRVVNE